MASEKVRTFAESSFEQGVLKALTPVLVDFWAAWCAPCRRLEPIVDALAAEFDGRLTVGKVDVDENLGVADRYGVRSIPTLILFKNGQVVEQVVGLIDRDRLRRLVEPHLDG